MPESQQAQRIDESTFAWAQQYALEHILESIPNPLWCEEYSDYLPEHKKGIMLFISDSYTEIWGPTWAQRVGKTTLEFWGEEGHKEWSPFVRQAFEEDGTVEFEPAARGNIYCKLKDIPFEWHDVVAVLKPFIVSRSNIEYKFLYGFARPKSRG